MGKHAAGDGATADIRIVSRSVTPEEVAAVTAVISAAVEEHQAQLNAPRQGSADAWERSRRGLRAPLDRGLDAWSGFPG